jgi:hypothetical protein
MRASAFRLRKPRRIAYIGTDSARLIAYLASQLAVARNVERGVFDHAIPFRAITGVMRFSAVFFAGSLGLLC